MNVETGGNELTATSGAGFAEAAELSSFQFKGWSSCRILEFFLNNLMQQTAKIHQDKFLCKKLHLNEIQTKHAGTVGAEE